MDFTEIVIVVVFFLLEKGHEAENLQKECLFLLFLYIYRCTQQQQSPIILKL